MKTNSKFRAVIATVMVVCLLVASLSASAAESKTIQPRLTGVSDMQVDLDITSAGRADCYSRVALESGYTGTLTMELKYSSNRILWDSEKTWSTSGSGTFTLDKSYYVSSGNYYYVVATVDVYNAAGTFVETVSLESSIYSY